MRKTMFTTAVMAIVMLVATGAMAKDTCVPVRVTYMKCEHQVAKIMEYETSSENGGFDVSRHEMHWYREQQDIDECNCRLTVTSEKYSSEYFDEDKFDREFHPIFAFIELKPFENSDGLLCVGSVELLHTHRSIVK